MLLRAQELSSIFSISSTSHCTICSNHSPSESLILSMRTAFGPLTLLRTLTLSCFHPNSRHIHRHSLLRTTSVETTGRVPRFLQRPLSTSADQLAIEAQNCGLEEAYVESEGFTFDSCLASTDLKHLSSTSFEVKELEELPEQWRRSKVAWLCKELPSHKPATLIRILNAQKKWITQEDCTYISVHCMRVRENEAGFRVYKWMMQQHWFRFDFALATKLADYMGKERKFTKCREIFDDIINQGRVPCESTFHILTVAYLSSPVQGCLEEACGIYNRMIQLGGYQPRLSLHNSLFRSLVSQPGGSSKQYLRQAEFIYHNLVTSRLEVHKDVYGGLIWLHSYQDAIDIERIISLREEMKLAGIEESKEVLLSILRICSKVNDVEEAERIWKILQSGNEIPSQAYVYKMETYAKVGQPMKSLEKFRQMKSPSTVAYHKIIEIFSKVQEIEFAESLMIEFRKSGLKPLMPSYIDLMEMYLNLGLHDKLGAIFSQCLEECLPNRTIYNIYLDSLVKIGNLGKAEEVFNQMHSNGAIGVNKRSCNFILSGYLSSGDHVKAEKIFDFMCQKKYDIEPSLMEKLDPVLRFKREVINKPMRLKLSKEQRETVIGLLLGGLRMESDENRKNHIIHFEFNENLPTHAVLKRHAYDQYHEWLNSFSKETDARNDDDVIPYRFSTIAHSYFSFYADQFWPSGIPMIPKLIHRWLSPRVLAYWYMYGGHRTPAGDILLKLKGNREGVERIVKTFKAKSFDCKVKQKGRVFWLGFFGSNSTWFWKLTEPYILDDLKDILKPGGQTVGNTMVETPNINFDSGSGSDGRASNYDDNDN